MSPVGAIGWRIANCIAATVATNEVTLAPTVLTVGRPRSHRIAMRVRMKIFVTISPRRVTVGLGIGANSLIRTVQKLYCGKSKPCVLTIKSMECVGWIVVLWTISSSHPPKPRSSVQSNTFLFNCRSTATQLVIVYRNSVITNTIISTLEELKEKGTPTKRIRFAITFTALRHRACGWRGTSSISTTH